MFEVVVGGRVHGDGLNAHFFTGTLNTQSDLTAIGYNYFFEHACNARLVCLPLVDDEQGLSVLDRLAVLYANRFDDTANIGLDLIHHLHCFDDAQGIAFLDAVADLHVGRSTWRRCAVKRADHGCYDREARLPPAPPPVLLAPLP